ncbi:hypothetical protein ABBQ38_001879 [Trebouxia sp. C0009 RCD-2024]
MWGQPLASKGKQYIFRGPYGYEPYPVATVNQKSHSWHGSAQVKLGDSHQVGYTFRPRYVFFGNGRIDIICKGRIVGLVSARCPALCSVRLEPGPRFVPLCPLHPMYKPARVGHCHASLLYSNLHLGRPF